MKFYHATTEKIMEEILKERKIKRSFDGVVYLCKKPLDCCKFLLIRGVKKEDIRIIQVDIPEKSAEESNDHDESFFKCKAYIYGGDICLNGKEKVYELE